MKIKVFVESKYMGETEIAEKLHALAIPEHDLSEAPHDFIAKYNLSSPARKEIEDIILANSKVQESIGKRNIRRAYYSTSDRSFQIDLYPVAGMKPRRGT